MRLAGPLALIALCSSTSALAEHTWTQRQSGASVEFLAVWGSSKTDVYAVSREGTVLHTSDGGKSWNTRTVAAAASGGGLAAVYGRDADTVYAAGGVHVLRTTDHGTTWTTAWSGTAEDKLEGVFAAGAGDVFAVGARGTIAHSGDSGATWERQNSATPNDLAAVWGSGEKDVYAVGTVGTILHSEDGGATWVTQTSPAGEEDLTAVWGRSKDAVYIVGSAGSILFSKDHGGTWTSLWKWDRPLSAVRGAGKNEVYCVATTGGTLLHSEDGQKFGQVKAGVDTALHGLWAGGPEDVYLVGELGVVLHSAPKGQKGFESRFGIRGAGREVLTAVWGASPDDVYLAGYLDNGAGLKPAHTAQILHSTDAGASWVVPHRAGGGQLLGMWGSGPTSVFVVGDAGTILHSKDGGKSWESHKTNLKTALRGVWGPSADEVYAVGDKGKILHTRDGGKVWGAEKAPASVDLRAVWGESKDAVFAAGVEEDKRELVVLGSTDGGKTWTELHRAPGAVGGGGAGVWGTGKSDVWAWVEGDTGELRLSHLTEKSKKWDPVVAGKGILHALWGASATDLYLVTTAGEVYHSTDAGKTWTDDKSGATESLSAVWGTSADNVYAVGDKGTVLHAGK